ncbi:MAG: hypothetical protein WBV94_09590 [Blastocatellia bacterium]
MPLTSLAARRQANTSDKYNLTVIQGRAVCLDRSGRISDSLFGCNDPSARFALVDRFAKLYNFAPTDIATAIFTDGRVRQRDLQVTARLDSKSQLEIIRVQSIKEGKLYNLYYFCEICNITAYAPGPCPCCGNELEFRETPT